MPRTKGSKNRVTSANIESIKADIKNLEEQLKVKKDELKVAIAAKEEEDKKRLLDAIATSGKSIEEVIEMLAQKPEGTTDKENPEK